MDRRSALIAIGSASVAGLAGCLGNGQGTEDTPETVAEWADGEIEFGLPPFQDEEELERQYAGIFEYLENRFDGVDRVEGVQTTSYSATVESVVGGHTELANLSPLIFVMAADEGITPLAVNELHGETSYHALIGTREETGIESLDELHGTTVAMVDPLSTSGGLFPMDMLEQVGLETGGVYDDAVDLTIQWAGDHNAALELLRNGHVDAAAFGDYLFAEPPSWVRILDKSDPIPLAAAVTQPDTPEPIESALEERLLATPEDALSEHVVSGFSAYNPADYDAVRSVADRFGLSVADLDESAD